MFLSLRLSYLYGLRVGVVHLYERRVARVDRHAHAHERLEPVGVRRAGGAHHEAERPGRGVHVEGVLHGALFAAQVHDVEGRVARRRDDLKGDRDSLIYLCMYLPLHP